MCFFKFIKALKVTISFERHNTIVKFYKTTISLTKHNCGVLIKPVHEISNNVVCATSKVLDQPAHMHSLIRAFASRLSIL